MSLVPGLTANRFVLCLVAIAFVATSARAAEYQPLEVIKRKPIEAAFQSANAKGNWTFLGEPKREGASPQSETIPAAEIVAWGGFRTFQPGHRLRLVSGGEIVGYQLEVDRERVILESDLVDRLELPISAASAILFDPRRESKAVTSRELESAPANAGQQVLFLTNGDRLTGRLVSIAGGKVEFQSAGKQITLDRTRVAAVVLNTQTNAPPVADETRTIVGLSDGSRLFATSIESHEKSLRLAIGDEVEIDVPIEAVVALQPFGGRVVYLSDLKPAGYRHVPFLQLPWSYELDRNVLGAPLRANGRLYRKGIGMHSASRITYDLNGEYEQFAADLAIDDVTGGKGSVTCRVFLDDGTGDWQLKYESPVIRGGQKPVPVEIDVASAKRISLLVDFADRGDEQDYVDWLNARLIKKP
jgi:NPCBM/NEW2 domain-containing protein